MMSMNYSEALALMNSKRLWTVIGTIDFTVNNIYASNEEEANDYVMNELSAELGGDAELYDWAVDIKSTEQD
jgi:hypothetical protein